MPPCSRVRGQAGGRGDGEASVVVAGEEDAGTGDAGGADVEEPATGTGDPAGSCGGSLHVAPGVEDPPTADGRRDSRGRCAGDPISRALSPGTCSTVSHMAY